MRANRKDDKKEKFEKQLLSVVTFAKLDPS